MSKANGCYTCSFGITVKHSRKGKPAPPVLFYEFPENTKLCPVQCIDAYKAITDSDRTQHQTSQFFLSVIKPYKPVTKATLTRWVVQMLDLSGIDTTKFKAHSVRSASSSKVSAMGLKIQDVLVMGNWSNESVWQKYYNKRITTFAERYQKTLLQG